MSSLKTTIYKPSFQAATESIWTFTRSGNSNIHVLTLLNISPQGHQTPATQQWVRQTVRQSSRQSTTIHTISLIDTTKKRHILSRYHTITQNLCFSLSISKYTQKTHALCQRAVLCQLQPCWPYIEDCGLFYRAKYTHTHTPNTRCLVHSFSDKHTYWLM